MIKIIAIIEESQENKHQNTDQFLKVQRVIQFNQKAWFKSYIDVKVKLRRKARTDFEKYFNE